MLIPIVSTLFDAAMRRMLIEHFSSRRLLEVGEMFRLVLIAAPLDARCREQRLFADGGQAELGR